MTKLMKTSISVQNIKCDGCARTITDKLSTIVNISNLQVDVEKKELSFNYLNKTDVSLVKERLKHLGFPSIEDNGSFTSKAKSFVSWATSKI